MSERINTLVLGGGGREHALVHALSKSAIIGDLHCAPGNPGIEAIASVHKLDPCDAPRVVSFCAERRIGLVAIGPEAPLAAGVADALRAAGVRTFGPGKSGAMLESSKSFSKKFMKRHGIPTADFSVCTKIEECEAALAGRKPPFVIKADGLAAGKGVFLPDNMDDALAICGELLIDGRLGDAGRTLVIEDYLPGRELTVFAITDGKSFRLLSPSRDHKRVFDGDKGSNTGGMGAYAPVNIPEGLMEDVTEYVLRPTLEGLRSDGIEYRGVLYMGLMLADEGASLRISVVEYNVRFGDPETQVVLPLLRGDFGRVVNACADGDLSSCPDLGNSGSALCVVAASGGYPSDNYERGLPIHGLDAGVPDLADSFVYHSGTRRDERGCIVTSGGRVLTAVGVGDSFSEAHDRAYARMNSISFKDMHYRRDIGWSEE
ncbi:MAG: phosphoribosylamine--glycine ligase [Synergistaceae bacterium]|jgi:phosphoribosylamine--glycine ligase|nr:phosphoribosylamine--glycine ligase [Synergistaceae bacterium]